MQRIFPIEVTKASRKLDHEAEVWRQRGSRGKVCPLAKERQPERSIYFIWKYWLRGQSPKSIHWLARGLQAEKPSSNCQQYPIVASYLNPCQIPCHKGAVSKLQEITCWLGKNKYPPVNFAETFDIFGEKKIDRSVASNSRSIKLVSLDSKAET